MPEKMPRSSLTLVALVWQFGLILFTLSLDLLSQDEVRLIFKEGHSIEVMTAVLFLAGAVLWFGWGLARAWPAHWHIPVILVLMGLRELDFDKRFTSQGLLKLRLYTGPAPPWEKAVGAAVVLVILVCGLRLAWMNLPGWWRALRGGRAVAWLAGAAGLLIVVSKTLDGLGRKLAPWGVVLTRWEGILSTRLEEMMEVGAAVLIVQAIAVEAGRIRAAARS
jgi:hypothetical protein